MPRHGARDRPGHDPGIQSFKDDLGADSIALVEFVFDLESEFSAMVGEFAVDDEDLQSLATVGDAVDYVVAALGS